MHGRRSWRLQMEMMNRAREGWSPHGSTGPECEWPARTSGAAQLRLHVALSLDPRPRRWPLGTVEKRPDQQGIASGAGHCSRPVGEGPHLQVCHQFNVVNLWSKNVACARPTELSRASTAWHVDACVVPTLMNVAGAGVGVQ